MALFGRDKWLERGETFSVYFHMFSTLSPGSRPATGRSGLRRPLSAADQLGRRGAGLGRSGPDRDRGDDLRRRRRGDAREPDHARSRAGSATSASGRVSRCGSTNAPVLGAHARLRRRPLLGRDLRHAHGPRRSSRPGELGRPVRPRLHPDRARLPDRALLQRVRLLRSRRSSASCSPTRSATAPTYFGTAQAGSTTGSSARTRSGTSRSRRWSLGHVIALVLGHDRALKVYGDTRTAARSQYWMLALMVGFTCSASSCSSRRTASPPLHAAQRGATLSDGRPWGLSSLLPF